MTEYLTHKQIKQLEALTKAPRDKLLIRTQYETGCTVSELVNLKREDLKNHSIHVNNRTCYVSKELLEELDHYLQRHKSRYVFTSRQNNQLTTKRVQQITKQLIQQVDSSIQKPTPHILRYSHIVHAAQQQIPLNNIMQQTGLAEQRISQVLTQALDSEDQAYTRLFS